MKTLKLISILILLCIAISNIACGDCNDENEAPVQQKSTPTLIHKDTLDVN